MHTEKANTSNSLRVGDKRQVTKEATGTENQQLAISSWQLAKSKAKATARRGGQRQTLPLIATDAHWKSGDHGQTQDPSGSPASAGEPSGGRLLLFGCFG
jgi:hypothetical protein